MTLTAMVSSSLAEEIEAEWTPEFLQFDFDTQMYDDDDSDHDIRRELPAMKSRESPTPIGENSTTELLDDDKKSNKDSAEKKEKKDKNDKNDKNDKKDKKDKTVSIKQGKKMKRPNDVYIVGKVEEYGGWERPMTEAGSWMSPR